MQNISRSIHYLVFLTAVLSGMAVFASEQPQSDRYRLPYEEDEMCIDNLPERYEALYQQFLDESELEDTRIAKESFPKKWWRKIKRWLSKRVRSLFCKINLLEKFRHPEEAFYTVAKFKRDIDRRIYHTGDINQILDQIQVHGNGRAAKHMEMMKARIKYYACNPGARPPKHPDARRYDFLVDHRVTGPYYECDLEEIPDMAIIGGVEVGCGVLLCIIPCGATIGLGSAMVTHGLGMIYDAYQNDPGSQSLRIEFRGQVIGME